MVTAPHRRPLTLALVTLLIMLAIARLLLAGERPLPPPERIFQHGVMRVGLDPSRPPFASFADDGEPIGLEIALAQALGETIGIEVQFILLGFDGLYDALRTDTVDVVIAGLQPPNPPNLYGAAYSQHYFDAGLVLVSEQPLNEMSQLGGKRLAYEFGTPANELARRWLRRIQPFELQPYELPTHALDAVRLGIADAALVDALNVYQYRRHHESWQMNRSQITHIDYTVVSRADRPDILRTVNHALNTLDNNGTLRALIEAWL